MRVVVSAICAWLPAVAFADVAPPPGYVERCTLENATETGDECVELTRWAFDGRCVKDLAARGFCVRCGKGATNRTEIYCRKRTESPLPADWTKQCLAEPDPKNLDAEKRPALPSIERCPTERTRSGSGDGDESGSGSKGKKPGGCSCSIVGSEGSELPWALSFVAGLALLRRSRRRRP